MGRIASIEIWTEIDYKIFYLRNKCVYNEKYSWICLGLEFIGINTTFYNVSVILWWSFILEN